MELKCLRTFRTIIDEGGFSKAAKKAELYTVHHYVSNESA